MLCCWEAMLGPDFIESYAGGAIRAIVMRETTPHEAIAAIAGFLDAEEAEAQEALQNGTEIARRGPDKDFWTET